MKKNQLAVPQSTALILGKSKSLMGITKRLLESKSKDLTKTKASQELATHEGITLIDNLMWEKESRKMNWDDAMEYAKNLRLGGYDNWRLPTKKEFLEIGMYCEGNITSYQIYGCEYIIGINKKNEAYQIQYKKLGFLNGSYWSSDTVVGIMNSFLRVSFNFYGGYSNEEETYIKNHVRCVRNRSIENSKKITAIKTVTLMIDGNKFECDIHPVYLVKDANLPTETIRDLKVIKTNFKKQMIAPSTLVKNADNVKFVGLRFLAELPDGRLISVRVKVLGKRSLFALAASGREIPTTILNGEEVPDYRVLYNDTEFLTNLLERLEGVHELVREGRITCTLSKNILPSRWNVPKGQYYTEPFKREIV